VHCGRPAIFPSSRPVAIFAGFSSRKGGQVTQGSQIAEWWQQCSFFILIVAVSPYNLYIN